MLGSEGRAAGLQGSGTQEPCEERGPCPYSSRDEWTVSKQEIVGFWPERWVCSARNQHRPERAASPRDGGQRVSPQPSGEHRLVPR